MSMSAQGKDRVIATEHRHDPADHCKTQNVVDPVCGMTVDPASAPYHSEHDGVVYFFCGAKCQSKFMAEPRKYLAPRSPASKPTPAKGVIYTCPMHPQIRRTEPGNCPICGMTLEPVTPGEETGPSPELIDMTRRFWIGTALTVPTVALEMGAHFPGLELHRYIS